MGNCNKPAQPLQNTIETIIRKEISFFDDLRTQSQCLSNSENILFSFSLDSLTERNIVQYLEKIKAESPPESFASLLKTYKSGWNPRNWRRLDSDSKYFTKLSNQEQLKNILTNITNIISFSHNPTQCSSQRSQRSLRGEKHPGEYIKDTEWMSTLNTCYQSKFNSKIIAHLPNWNLGDKINHFQDPFISSINYYIEYWIQYYDDYDLIMEASPFNQPMSYTWNPNAFFYFYICFFIKLIVSTRTRDRTTHVKVIEAWKYKAAVIPCLITEIDNISQKSSKRDIEKVEDYIFLTISLLVRDVSKINIARYCRWCNYEGFGDKEGLLRMCKILKIDAWEEIQAVQRDGNRAIEGGNMKTVFKRIIKSRCLKSYFLSLKKYEAFGFVFNDKRFRTFLLERITYFPFAYFDKHCLTNPMSLKIYFSCNVVDRNVGRENKLNRWLNYGVLILEFLYEVWEVFWRNVYHLSVNSTCPWQAGNNRERSILNDLWDFPEMKSIDVWDVIFLLNKSNWDMNYKEYADNYSAFKGMVNAKQGKNERLNKWGVMVKEWERDEKIKKWLNDFGIKSDNLNLDIEETLNWTVTE